MSRPFGAISFTSEMYLSQVIVTFTPKRRSLRLSLLEPTKLKRPTQPFCYSMRPNTAAQIGPGSNSSIEIERGRTETPPARAPTGLIAGFCLNQHGWLPSLTAPAPAVPSRNRHQPHRFAGAS